MAYEFTRIARKWQEKWKNAGIFKVTEDPNKKKFYCLEMYPYPSGSGLHMGHARNYSIGDCFARYKRMNGFNVLYPMGYDSFGLPAENAAIKAKSHPKVFTEKAITNFIRQQKELGLSYDWDRMIASHTPEYYKWDQWIFLKLFEKGLAYKKKSAVNWCGECKTVLANEQVVQGKCWRHGQTDVETKDLNQWFFKITDYADRLLEGHDRIDWPEDVITMQKNWIGRKVWIDIDYEIAGTDKKLTVSTTRPDTNFGATFVVIAPENPLLSTEANLIPTEHREEVDNYIESAKQKTEEERLAEKKKKTGVFTGLYCINQLTNNKMPIYVTDFVLMTVGTGCVVGVPGHDLRDFEFAREFDLPIIRVVVGSDGDTSEITREEQVQEEEGTMINSGFLNGLDIHAATKTIMDHIEEKGWGRRTVRYRLRDWLISRQRFWGCPIPIIYCDKCGVVPVPEKDLPVLLPNEADFTVQGSPLAGVAEFVNTSCPKCNGAAKRETDTMDTFVDSSWYFLRYTDAKNDKEIFSKEKADYWMPIDLYIGGKEHATGHLIYSRFFTKFFYDLGLIKYDEPAKRLFNQGMLHKDGVVMSKSKGNVVTQEEIAEKYGIDTGRFFMLFVASPDKDMEWDDKGAEGSFRFLNKMYNMITKGKITDQENNKIASKMHRTIKKITEDIEDLKYNTALIQLMSFGNYLNKQTELPRKAAEVFVKLLSPFCPHIAEELWEHLGYNHFVTLSDWPKFNENKIDPMLELEEDFVECIISDIREVLELAKIEQPKKITLFAAPQWKYDLFRIVKNELAETRNVGEILKKVMQTDLKQHGKAITKIIPRLVKKMYDHLDRNKEKAILVQSQKLIEDEFKCKLEILNAESSDVPKAKNAMPGKPAILVE